MRAPAGPAALAVPGALGVLGLVVLDALVAPVGAVVLAVGSLPVGIGGRPAVGTDRGRVDRVADRGMAFR